MGKSVLSTGMIKYWPHLLKALNLLRLPARFLDLSIWIGRRFITIRQLQNGLKINKRQYILLHWYNTNECLEGNVSEH